MWKKLGLVLLNIAVLCFAVVVVRDIMSQPSTQIELDKTHKGCYYYKYTDLADSFANCLGYMPNVKLNCAEKVATVQLRTGIKVEIPMGLYARSSDGDTWGFECPAKYLDAISSWKVFSYVPNINSYNRYYFITWDEANSILSNLGWSEEILPAEDGIRFKFSDDDPTTYFLWEQDVDGVLMIEGHYFSQMLYEHEMKSHPSAPATPTLNVFRLVKNNEDVSSAIPVIFFYIHSLHI